MLTSNDAILAAQKQMNSAALELSRMANDLADSKTIKQFSADRLKRALSVTVTEFLSKGEGAAASEHKSRASAQYGSALHDLSEQYKAAMRVIEAADAARVRYESARSILAVEREKLSL